MFQLGQPVSAELEVKKSRFIAWVGPVSDRKAAKEVLAMLRQQHPTAGHCCWALITEGDSGLDDDGEPAGTAAKPIYNVLTHKHLSSVLGVVIRYWGGVKLGAGGLTRAYGQAVSDALKLAEFVPIIQKVSLAGRVPFADEAAFRRLCGQHQVDVVETDYATDVGFVIAMPLLNQAPFEQAANDLLRGKWVSQPIE